MERKVHRDGEGRRKTPEVLEPISQVCEAERRQRESEFGDDNEGNFLMTKTYGGASHPFLSSLPPPLLPLACYLHVFKNVLSSSGLRLVQGTQRTDSSFLQASFPPSPATWELNRGRRGKT